jgi:hypothetical protein
MPPDTSENIHVAQIFNGNIHDSNEEIGIVDLVWGSNHPTQPPGVFNLYYYPFDRDADGNSGGGHHDYSWFKVNHPDWIEYRCDRKTPANEYGDPNVPLDISNPAVIDYMFETYLIPAIQDGYAGIAFDNVDFNNYGMRCGVWRDGEWVAQPDYIGNIFKWAVNVVPRLHDLNAAVAMNCPYDSKFPSEMEQIYQYVDIALDEGGFTNWGSSSDGYYSDDTWLQIMRAMQSLDGLGKGFVSINEMPVNFDQLTHEQINWALANYLLAKGRHSYIAITGIQEYGVLLDTPEYHAAIGYPVGAMYQVQQIYMRDFTNGLAIVNPSSVGSFTITLPAGTFQDLYGEDAEVLLLEPHHGIVLLRKKEIPGLSFP